VIYPVDRVIQPLNNWGLDFSVISSCLQHSQVKTSGNFANSFKKDLKPHKIAKTKLRLTHLQEIVTVGFSAVFDGHV